MRNRIVGLLALAAGSLIACRALVGIEDYPIGDAGKDADVDAESVDAGVDAFVAKNAECQKKECRKCCKEGYVELHDLEIGEATRRCICEASRCGNPCGGDGGYCGGNAQPSESCVRCLDDRLVENDCTLDCRSPRCLAGLSCLQGCPNP